MGEPELVGDELDRIAVAQVAAGDGAAHGGKERRAALLCGLVAADEDGELAVTRAVDGTGDRRIDHHGTPGRDPFAQFAHEGGPVGRHVGPDLACREAGDQAVLALGDRLHLGRAGHRGQHDVDRFGHGARAVGPGRAGGDLGRRLGLVDLGDREVVARLEQVERHGAAHDAQADESHLHVATFPSNALQ